LEARRFWNFQEPLAHDDPKDHGTPGYAAPEQFQGVEARPSADLYSLGKLLVFLLTGQTDIDYVRFSAWRELIARCVRQDPAQRPSIAAVIEELSGLPA
jgi:eukaryotic-like serine/threonine-protein kinase